MENTPELILYQTEDGNTRLEVQLQDGSVWLSQVQLAELFQTTKQNVSLHIKNIFEENELPPDSTVKEYLTVQTEGNRGVRRSIQLYNLDIIISVGYRIKSNIATKFRIWATQRLREYIVKGFTLDDERLKESGHRNAYFDELLERVRDIRTSEKNFYYKIKDIYATSIDYDVNSTLTHEFFATAQNKFHYAIHHHTAAELIASRANAGKRNMGLTVFKGDKITKADTSVAKNYLTVEELKQLNLLVDQYLSFAESQAMQRKPMYMKYWIKKLHDILTVNERDILLDKGKVPHDKALEIAGREYEKYKVNQDRLAIAELKQLEGSVKNITSSKQAPKPNTKTKKKR